jgi:hypothetical protein
MPFMIPRRASKQLIDETGRRYGVVTVTGRAANDGRGNARWRVQCDACGESHVLIGTQMRRSPPGRCPALISARKKGGGVTIERYDLDGCYAILADESNYLLPNPEGTWVRYEDHAAALAEARAESAPMSTSERDSWRARVNFWRHAAENPAARTEAEQRVLDACAGLNVPTLGAWRRGECEWPSLTELAEAELALRGLKRLRDTKKREPGCECDQEEGDSPCVVHGLYEAEARSEAEQRVLDACSEVQISTDAVGCEDGRPRFIGSTMIIAAAELARRGLKP